MSNFVGRIVAGLLVVISAVNGDCEVGTYVNTAYWAPDMMTNRMLIYAVQYQGPGKSLDIKMLEIKNDKKRVTDGKDTLGDLTDKDEWKKCEDPAEGCLDRFYPENFQCDDSNNSFQIKRSKNGGLSLGTSSYYTFHKADQIFLHEVNAGGHNPALLVADLSKVKAKDRKEDLKWLWDLPMKFHDGAYYDADGQKLADNLEKVPYAGARVLQSQTTSWRSSIGRVTRTMVWGVSTSTDNEGGLSGCAIAGIVIAVVGVLVLVGLVVFCCVRRRRQRQQREEEDAQKQQQRKSDDFYDEYGSIERGGGSPKRGNWGRE